MQFLRIAALVILSAMLPACSDGANGGAGGGTPADPAAQAPDPIAQEPAVSGPEDVTAAGFPFLPGRYITGDDCSAAEPDFTLVDFTPEYSHEHEADGNIRFASILRIADGHYRIVEEWPDFETDGTFAVEADYIADGEDGFRRETTTGSTSDSLQYRYCAADTVIGQM